MVYLSLIIYELLLSNNSDYASFFAGPQKAGLLYKGWKVSVTLNLVSNSSIVLSVKATLLVLWMVYFLVAVWPRPRAGSPLVWWSQSASVEWLQEAVARSDPRTNKPPSASNIRRQSSPSARVGRPAERPTTGGLYLHTARMPREDELFRRRCTRTGSRTRTHPRCCHSDRKRALGPCE